jgi:hypothetical protein
MRDRDELRNALIDSARALTRQAASLLAQASVLPQDEGGTEAGCLIPTEVHNLTRAAAGLRAASASFLAYSEACR